MPSWIKIRSGETWYDERYSSRQSGKKSEQLRALVKTGAIKMVKERNKDAYWFRATEIDVLHKKLIARQEALKRQKAKPKTAAYLEREWEKMSADRDKARAVGLGTVSVLGRHAVRLMLAEIEVAKKENEKH